MLTKKEILEKSSFIGTVSRISSTVIDVIFSDNAIPDVLTIVYTFLQNSERPISLEVVQHLGYGAVRCIALDALYGLQCGSTVWGLGKPIEIPIGHEVLGRMINGLGEPLDGMPEIHSEKWSIYRTN